MDTLKRYCKHLALALLAAAAALAGAGSLVLFFGAFLPTTHLDVVDLGLPLVPALCLDVLLCFVFFVQHSGMVRKRSREWLGRGVPPSLHGAIYTLASAAALVSLSVFWQPTDIVLLNLGGTESVALRPLSVLVLAGFVWAFVSLGSVDAFGSKAALSHAAGGTPAPPPLRIRGPYRWVRHPLYFLSIVLVWASPALSLDRLLFNLLFSVWLVLGTRWEDRDLAAAYGDAYRAYQARVPMLMPRGLPRRESHPALAST